jgi:hypothetical protein
MAGRTSGPLPLPPGASTSPTSSFGNPASFTAAANTQASDYDTIMQGYKDMMTKNAQSPIFAGTVSYQPIAAQTSNYQQSGDVTRSLANLSDLSTTGGYTEQGKADLRARGISPTRSIYANAQQNVERQRALAGGYSPNFNATQAQMARDESNQISGINTDVNAGIAQNVATNRIAAASPYASASANANAAQTQSDQHNADIINQINMMNAQGSMGANQFNSDAALRAAMFNRGNMTGSLQGMTSLYGTTPALTATFGNQVNQAANIGQGQQDLNQKKINSTFGNAGRIAGSVN